MYLTIISVGVQATTDASVIAESRLGTVGTSNSSSQQLAYHGEVVIGEALNVEPTRGLWHRLLSTDIRSVSSSGKMAVGRHF